MEDEDFRIFRCIGLNEHRVRTWSRVFKLGCCYELLTDGTGIIQLATTDNAGHKTSRWVDADQFEEVTIEDILIGLKNG